jgi:hypothetical protein
VRQTDGGAGFRPPGARIQVSLARVDCLGMRSRPSFAEKLDEALGAAHDDTPQADRFVYLPVSAAPFVFVYSRPAGSVAAMGAPATPAAAAGARRAYERPAGSMRGPVAVPTGLIRALTPRQQRAFDAMTALGAGLRGDFEAADLRRAFRQLAREFHPDTHPDCTPAELAHLSRTFADLHDHYRCLLAIFDRTR